MATFIATTQVFEVFLIVLNSQSVSQLGDPSARVFEVFLIVSQSNRVWLLDVRRLWT